MLMILTVHILIAVSSLLLALYTLFVPTQKKLSISYGLIGLTVVSGTYMILATPSHMMQACASGLTYLAVVFVMIAFARRKLVAVTTDKN